MGQQGQGLSKWPACDPDAPPVATFREQELLLPDELPCHQGITQWEFLISLMMSQSISHEPQKSYVPYNIILMRLMYSRLFLFKNGRSSICAWPAVDLWLPHFRQ